METLMKISSRITIKTLFLTFFLAICFVQCFDLLKEYLSYPTVQKVFVKPTSLIMPSVTFCHSNQSKFIAFVNNTDYSISSIQSDFDNKYDLIFSAKGGQFCATYFSQLIPENKIEEFYKEKHFAFTTSFEIEKVSLHSSLMPPQLTFLKSAGCFFMKRFRVLHKNLKPAPYDTNCINYDELMYKSQYDC